MRHSGDVIELNKIILRALIYIIMIYYPLYVLVYLVKFMQYFLQKIKYCQIDDFQINFNAHAA